jgi:hypothetical protein
MRNQKWPSIITASLIAAALVIGPGLALVAFVSANVHPVNENLDRSVWQAHYEAALGWSAGVAALLTAIWLFIAHSGDGMDTKAGTWFMLWLLAIMSGVALAAFIPENVKEGPGLPMGISALLVLFGYWIPTLFLTPSHYRYTPLLAKTIWGKK